MKNPDNYLLTIKAILDTAKLRVDNYYQGLAKETDLEMLEAHTLDRIQDVIDDYYAPKNNSK